MFTERTKRMKNYVKHGEISAWLAERRKEEMIEDVHQMCTGIVIGFIFGIVIGFIFGLALFG